MNILFLDQFSEMGGAQRCLLDLIPAVCSRGWNAHVAAPGNGPLLSLCAAQGATASSLDFGPYSAGRKSALDIARFVLDHPRLVNSIRALSEQSRAGVLYVNGPRLLPAAARAARRRLPVVFHCHSYLGRGYAAWLVRRSLEFAKARVIACSHFVAEPLEPVRSQVIYNGVPGGAPRRGAFPQGDAWRIGVIGRVAPEKGQAEFLRAARMIHGCNFVICGAPLFTSPRYAGELNQLAAGMPVEFLGWREDTEDVLASLDLLVVPSRGEDATPRVILEAWVAGVPVVAFGSGGIREIVADGRTGFLVEPRTHEALSARINALLRLPDELARVAANAHACWRERFTVERYRADALAVVSESSRRNSIAAASAIPAAPASTGG